jgi:hypothetical protein
VPSPHDHDAGEAYAKQRKGCRFGYGGRHLCDDDLAVSGLETGDQDLVGAGVEGAAAAARWGPAATSATAVAAASTATWISRTAAATKASVPADDVERGDAAGAASSKIWEGAAAPSLAEGAKWTDAITTGAEEATTPATTAEAPERTATSTAVTAVPAVTGATSVAAGETASVATALAGGTSATSAASAPTAAATTDNQRRVIGTDHEGATTPTTARHTRAADGDLESFPGSQAKIATDLGPETAGAARKPTVSTLRAKGEDLIGVGRRHRKIDNAAGEGKIKDDRCGLGAVMGCGKRQERCTSDQKLFHFLPLYFWLRPRDSRWVNSVGTRFEMCPGCAIAAQSRSFDFIVLVLFLLSGSALAISTWCQGRCSTKSTAHYVAQIKTFVHFPWASRINGLRFT